MDMVSEKLFLYIIIILSAVFHEYAHGFAAFRLGDSTAKDHGRLTLNPLAHIDIFGTVILPLVLLFTSGIFFGWAKPVPYNPNNLRDQRYGSLKVGIAGPSANLLIALILGLFLRLTLAYTDFFFGFSPVFLELVGAIVYVNIFLALFNLLPFPPLDGSKIFADLFPIRWRNFERIGFAGIGLAILLAFFFLPPLANFLFRLITGENFGF